MLLAAALDDRPHPVSKLLAGRQRFTGLHCWGADLPGG
jgi:hypothetical protein